MFSLAPVSVSVVAKKMMSDFMDLLSCQVPNFPVTSEMETLSCLVHNAQHECCFPYWTFLASLLPDRGNLKPSEVTKHMYPPPMVSLDSPATGPPPQSALPHPCGDLASCLGKAVQEKWSDKVRVPCPTSHRMMKQGLSRKVEFHISFSLVPTS